MFLLAVNLHSPLWYKYDYFLRCLCFHNLYLIKVLWRGVTTTTLGSVVLNTDTWTNLFIRIKLSCDCDYTTCLLVCRINLGNYFHSLVQFIPIVISTHGCLPFRYFCKELELSNGKIPRATERKITQLCKKNDYVDFLRTHSLFGGL